MLPKSYPAEGEASPLVGRNAVPSQLDMADEARLSTIPTAAPAPLNTYGSQTPIDDYTRDTAPVGADFRDSKYSLNIDDDEDVGEKKPKYKSEKDAGCANKVCSRKTS